MKGILGSVSRQSAGPLSSTNTKSPSGLAQARVLELLRARWGPWERVPGPPEEVLQAGHPVSFFEGCFCF